MTLTHFPGGISVGTPAVEIDETTTALTDLTASAAELNKLDGAGDVVASGTAVTHITDASVAHAVDPTNAASVAADADTALDALGAKINLIIDALEAFGIDPGA